MKRFLQMRCAFNKFNQLSLARIGNSKFLILIALLTFDIYAFKEMTFKQTISKII